MMILRMYGLSKGDYATMKRMIGEYGLSDHTLTGPMELFTVALRLMAEVEQFDGGAGHAWIIRIINDMRSTATV